MDATKIFHHILRWEFSSKRKKDATPDKKRQDRSKKLEVKKAFTIIGKKLEKEYKKLGFKYSRNFMYLTKSTEKFVYHIFFSSFSKDTPSTYIELHVTLSINDKALLKTYSDSRVFCMDLWETGNHYIIENEKLINNAFMDLRNKVESYLMPQIERLEVGGAEVLTGT
jgi:hypothetical protein